MNDDLLQTVEHETGSPVDASILWLHGLGADGHDFEPLVPELVLDGVGVRFVFPHAPVREVTLNMGMEMRAWFDVYGLDRRARQDEEGIRESERQTRALIQRERDRDVPADRIVLAGFSQGAAIALHTGLRFEEPLAGILALSTYLPLHQTFDAEASDANRATPIFQAHGTADPMVAMSLGETTRDFLKERGYSIEWKDYPMPHAVCPDEVADIRAWLGRRLLPAD